MKVIELAPLGVAPDLPPFTAPPDVWTTGNNARVVGGGMQRVNGVAEYLEDVGAGLLFVPKFVAAVTDPTGKRWVVYMGDGGVGACDAIAHYNITPSAGWQAFTAGGMTATIHNGLLVFNAPNMPPWYWDFTLVVGAVKALPGFLAATQAQVIGAVNRHLFAGSLAVGASSGLGRLAWSDAAAWGTIPATWVPTATNQAGELTLGDGVGAIAAMAPLATSLIVYRTSGCWAVTYVGRPYIYTARKVAGNVGCVSRNGVGQALGRHVVLGLGDVYLTDGATVTPLGDKRIKRRLFQSVSEAGLRVAHVLVLPNRGEVIVAVPEGQDAVCNVGYVWNYNDDKWSIVDLPDVTHGIQAYPPYDATVVSWDTFPGSWDDAWQAWTRPAQGGAHERALFASPTRDRLLVWDEGDVWPGNVPIVGELARLSMPIDSTDRVKWVTRMFPRVNAAPGTVLRMQVGGQIDAGDSVTWGPEQLYTTGDSGGVSVGMKARFVSMRVRSDSVNQWTLSGVGLEYRLASRF